jgi:predicted metalloendopeptidase
MAKKINWMSPETKKQAWTKLSKSPKIGPDQWEIVFKSCSWDL